MLDMNPMLLCDTYKTVHNMMYPEGLEYLVSYWVPRKSYFEKEGNQKMVWFGHDGMKPSLWNACGLPAPSFFFRVSDEKN